MFLFYKPIRGPSAAMHLCIYLSTVDASLDGIYISLELVSASLLGVGRWGGFSSHRVYTRLMARLSSDHWVCLFFTRWVSNNLAFWQKPCRLRSVLKGSSFQYSLSSISRRRLQSCPKYISPANLCASCWGFSFRSIFLVVSYLVVGLLDMSEIDSLLRDPLHYWGYLWWFDVSNIVVWN